MIPNNTQNYLTLRMSTFTDEMFYTGWIAMCLISALCQGLVL